MIVTVFLAIMGASMSQNQNLTWQLTSAPEELQYSSIASDLSGQRLIASVSSSIYLSENYGETWSVSPNTTNIAAWSSFAMESTGQEITAASKNGGLFKSADYGQSFVNVFPYDAFAFNDVAVSYDGVFQYAVAPGNYGYRSNNSGETWEVMNMLPPNNPVGNWYAVATSLDGSYVYAVMFNGNGYYSNDYGATWFLCFGTDYADWNSVATSASGEFVAVARLTGDVSVSVNYGLNFTHVLSAATESAITNGFSAVTMDSTGCGQYLAAAESSVGGIWLSDNYGAEESWYKGTATTQYYTDIAGNGKGNYLVATTQSDLSQFSGNIYTTYNITTIDTNGDGGGDDNSLSTGALVGIFIAGIAVIIGAILFLKYYVCAPKEEVGIAEPLV